MTKEKEIMKTEGKEMEEKEKDLGLGNREGKEIR